MSDSLSIKRQHAKLPSLRRHGLAAIAVVGVCTAGLLFSLKFFGNPNDAISQGKVAIVAIPLPPLAESLNGASDALPDLLAGEVALNVNPTEAIDALGNPITTAKPTPQSAPEILVQRPVSPDSTGPKTILIDGKAIGGSGSRAASPLSKAPIAGLSRMSAYGRVPAPAPDGRRAVKAYARPYSADGSRTVSIIVGGLGVNAPVTRRAITELPPDVTLSFAAHAANLQNWVNQARARGHEVLIELPMESAGYNPAEPGADRTLMASGGSAENIRNLDWLLSRAQGYFAVTNYNGDAFVTRADAAAPVLAHLSDAGLGFVFDGSSSAPSLQPLASNAKLPYASGFALIDNDTAAASIGLQLDRLTANASAKGPIGVGFSYPQTIDAIKLWAAELPPGTSLAPVSHMLSSGQ